MLRIIAALALALLSASADARPRGAPFAIAAPTGGALVNTSGSDPIGGFLNVFDAGHTYTLNGGVTPAQLDVNGYPITTLTAGQTVGLGLPFLDSQTGPGTTWVFKWTPVGGGVYFFNATWSNVVNTTPGNCTISGGNVSVTFTAGLPCRITFTWTTPPGTGLISRFDPAAYLPGSPKLVLCRLSDEAAVDAGNVDFTSELLSRWRGLSLETIRTMNWLHSDDQAKTTQSLWQYRSTRNSFGWKAERYPPGAWAGASTGTNQYTVALPADSGSGGWVDGEVIQATMINAATAGNITVTGAANNGSGLIRLTVSSTATLTTGQQVYVSGVNGTQEANGIQTVTVISGTTIDLQGTTFVNTYVSSGRLNVLSLTVTGKTSGTKFIASEDGSATGSISANTIYTFVYDELLDVVKARAGGITGAMPIEVIVNLANTVGVNIWTTLPTYATKTYDYAKSEAALICSLLNPVLKWHSEYTNEVWNTGFPQTGYAVNGGNVLGISGHSFYSLRVRQMQEAIRTQWVASGCPASRHLRVLAWQGFGDSSTTSQRLNSSQLNTASNAKLLAYTGSVNYTTAGQRAIDFTDVGSYGTYFTGPAMATGFDLLRYQIDSASQAVAQQLADLFNANPNDATALALLDKDIRYGTTRTQTVNSVAGTTITITSPNMGNDFSSITIGAGGSGYTNGDQTLTVLGGTCTTQPKISVNVTGNAVTTARFFTSLGQCAVAPTNPAATSGGGGTGATLNVPYSSMYPNGRVVLFSVAPGGTMYTGATENTPYFVVNSSGNTFSIASTLGGTPIALSGGSGTITVGVLRYENLLELSRFVYQNVGGNLTENPGWEQVAATYDAYRAGVGQPLLMIKNYEGGLEAQAPTTAQCTSMGVLVGGSAAACSAALTAGLNAYKNSAYGQTLATDFLNRMMGRDPADPLTYGVCPGGGCLMAHSVTPSWFLMVGPSQWSLLSGRLDTTPFKTYDGVAAFH